LYISGFWPTRLLFEDLKKVEFRVGRILFKKRSFFSKIILPLSTTKRGRTFEKPHFDPLLNLRHLEFLAKIPP
jgi:hypothetical protein